jgi:hypothetical protein
MKIQRRNVRKVVLESIFFFWFSVREFLGYGIEETMMLLI